MAARDSPETFLDEVPWEAILETEGLTMLSHKERSMCVGVEQAG
jgi:hypothetical protein